jgi:hypothetical protein
MWNVLKSRVFKRDEIFLGKIFHFYPHFVPNGTGDGGGKIVSLGTFELRVKN